MEIKKGISLPAKGMNRDTNIDRLQDGEFTFALNSDSNGRVRHNEPSNYLYTIFPEGYEVIGLIKDNLKSVTYYWLTNPKTTFSSFGYVEDKLTEHLNDDIQKKCVDCKDADILGTPLENTVQTPEFLYKELFNDTCLPKGEGLNFDIRFPIKHPVIKSEQSSTRIYWEDNRNRPRFVIVDDVSYLFEENNPCGDNIKTNCLQIYKLNQFPDSTPLNVEVVSQENGGNLRRGTYEILVAYSDESGAEMSDYSTATNVVKIFDLNNRILESQTLDSTTNYAIKVKVNNLDFTNFKYFKVVVVERGVLDSTQIAFEEGVFPTTSDEILITSSGRLYTNTNRDTNLTPKKTINLNTLFLRKLKIEKANGEAIIGDRKYIHGVKRKSELNIQPVVNLFSPLAEWQTVFANENLYENGALGSNYGSYRRDEVQPFSLRLLNRDGSKSTPFPMVSRPSNESDRESVSDDIVEEFSGLNCSTEDRKEKWQYYNTAKISGSCNTLEEGVEIYQPERRVCIIDNVHTIPANSVVIETTSDFTGIRDYIEDNPELNIPEITPYLNNTYPDKRCYPSFGTVSISGELVVGKTYVIHNINTGDDFSNTGFESLHTNFIATASIPNSWSNATEVEETTCDSTEVESTNISISSVVNEQLEKQESIFPTEYDKLSSGKCSFYAIGENGKPERDVEFSLGYDAVIDVMEQKLVSRKIYTRNYNFSNESCTTSDILQETGNFTTLQKYWFRYLGADTVSELETNKVAKESGTGFTLPIKKTALWFRAQPSSQDKFIIEVSKTEDPTNKDVLTRNGKNKVQNVRISFFNSCSSQEAFYSKIYSAKTEGFQAMVTKIGNSIVINDGTVTTTVSVNNPFPSGSFYISIDPCIVTGIGGAVDEDSEYGFSDNYNTAVERVRTAPPHGCFSIAVRPIEYNKFTVTWDGIVLDKIENYVSTCKYIIPNNLNCEPVPYQKGEFSFWESTKTYPDNKDLYDGSELKIKPQHLNFQPYSLRTRFENYFVSGYDNAGNYVFKEGVADLRCKPIRHFKFPDNSLVPFCSNINLPQGAESFIFPIGINLDARIVQVMLKVAEENGLITKQQREDVVGFEILRGDNTYSKSVVSSGIMFDMYKYNKDNKDIYYSNFPYNDLGDDLFHYESLKSSNLIKHPFNGRKNNKFTFISPDLLHTKTTLPFELNVSGFLKGNADSTFTELDGHAKWTILGKKARNTATTLAIAESALETAISIGTATGSQWFTVGISSGASLGLVGTSIISAANLLSGFTKIGQYRYDWLQTFRNLGATYNFGYYGYSHGKYSSFMVNRNESEKLRRLTVSKYLPHGDFSVLDEGTKEGYKINNFQREESVLLSTGANFVNYPLEYVQLDNSNFNSSSSGATNSKIGCENKSFSPSIGSPYVSLKNYVPDQYGEIGSVNWLGTGKYMMFGKDNKCTPVFGGNVSITRFTYKRKVPFFRRTAYNSSDKTTYEYSSAYNIGRSRYYCDYETDTEYNGLVIPFPDIDSDYRLDCLTSSNRFYIRGGKLYTAYYSVVDFLVESEMNLNFRYGGVDLKEQFYPLYSDLEDLTQEKNVSIREVEEIKYSNVYSLPNIYSGATILPYSYDKAFYEKLAESNNEVIWSEQDLVETNRIQDPYLVYKPVNSYSFETKVGELKSLKESTKNQAVARFTDGMQVFNTVDVLADKITPQTSELGTGGIFAQGRPVNFVNSSLGFSGTQHYNIIDTEYGDIHIDSERGQILMLNNQANGLEDLAYSIQGEPSNMNKWFKANLPFKIKKYFSNVDIDNPFYGIGISGGYDAVNKRAFITKKDYIPKGKCKSCETDNLVVNGNLNTDLSGWDNYQEGYSWSNGKMWNTDSADITPKIRQNILTVGKKYKITFDLFINPNCKNPSIIGQPPKFVKVFAGTTESHFIVNEGNTQQTLTLTCADNSYFEFQTGFSCSVGYAYNGIGISNVCVVELEDSPLCCMQEIDGQIFDICNPGNTCPIGYTLNEDTQMCEREILTPAICIERVMFSFFKEAKKVCDGQLIDFSGGTKEEVKCAYILPETLGCSGGVQSGVVLFINGDIAIGMGVYAGADYVTPYPINGNFVSDSIATPTLAPGIPANSRYVITLTEGIVTGITNFDDLIDC